MIKNMLILILHKKMPSIAWTMLLVFCILSGCGNKANNHNKEGILFYNKGKYTEAIGEFIKALELNPSFYDAHYHLGIVYYAKGMTDESIIELKKGN